MFHEHLLSDVFSTATGGKMTYYWCPKCVRYTCIILLFSVYGYSCVVARLGDVAKR